VNDFEADQYRLQAVGLLQTTVLARRMQPAQTQVPTIIVDGQFLPDLQIYKIGLNTLMHLQEWALRLHQEEDQTYRTCRGTYRLYPHYRQDHHNHIDHPLCPPRLNSGLWSYRLHQTTFRLWVALLCGGRTPLRSVWVLGGWAEVGHPKGNRDPVRDDFSLSHCRLYSCCIFE
jgi:hypothetical protein